MSILVGHMDAVYRLSDTAYRRALRARADGEYVNPGQYGKCLGPIECDLTALTRDEAKQLLTKTKTD